MIGKAYLQTLKKIPTNEKVFLFSGVGNPKFFKKTIKHMGFNICGTKKFADHFSYGKKDINDIKPIPGKDVFTTIDLSLQKTLEKAMSSYKGIVLVTDPATGQILAFVSSPDFSPDIFTGNTTLRQWREIVSEPTKPLLNRITNGLYPPGSTLKMITAIALLEGLTIEQNEEFECAGIYQFGDRVFKCWKIK